VAIALIVVAVVAGSLALLLAGGGDSAGTTTARNGEVWLQGEISQDTCGPSVPPVHDIGCSITVNGYEVALSQGNVGPPVTPGTVTGLDGSRDQTGSHADVYAQLTGPHLASILGAPRYYVRISG
jgi:hypothetical protein